MAQAHNDLLIARGFTERIIGNYEKKKRLQAETNIVVVDEEPKNARPYFEIDENFGEPTSLTNMYYTSPKVDSRDQWTEAQE